MTERDGVQKDVFELLDARWDRRRSGLFEEGLGHEGLSLYRIEVDHDVGQAPDVEVDGANVAGFLCIQYVCVDCVEVEDVSDHVLQERGHEVVQGSELCLLHEHILVDAVCGSIALPGGGST